MSYRHDPNIHSDELERRLLDAAEAIRKNAERGRTLKLRKDYIVRERNKPIILPAPEPEEGEEGDLE